MDSNISRVLAVTSAAFLFTLSTPCLAWGGDVSEIRQVYQDKITVKMANGQHGHAEVSISITATAFVGQDGNAKFPDNRACYYNDIRITLVRSLTFTTPDGLDIPVRDTTVALPSQGGHHWSAVNTCNDKINEIKNRLSDATGSAEKWQSYIDGQKADINRILAQFGQVV